MATVFEEYNTEEQCSVVHSLWANALNEISSLYCGKCLSRKAVHSWVGKFSQRRTKLADAARPGRPVEIATETVVLQRVEELIRADRRINRQ
jgi:transposase